MEATWIDFVWQTVWRVIAGGLSWLDGQPVYMILGCVGGLLSLIYGMALGLQWKLVKYLEPRPEQTAPLGRWEAMFSILAPATVLFFALEGMTRSLHRRVRGSKEPDWKVKHPSSAKNHGKPVLIATLGPTFLLSGVGTAVVYWLARLAEPFFAEAFSHEGPYPYWESKLLSSLLALDPPPGIFPLVDHPKVALILCLLFWTAFWWTYGNLLRGLVYRADLQRNLASRRETALPLWTSWFGVKELARAGEAYRGWAAWLVTASILLTVGAGMTLNLASNSDAAVVPGTSDQAVQVSPSALVVALILVLSWLLHLHLKGKDSRPGLKSRRAATAQPDEVPGWKEVVEKLTERYRLPPPEFRSERPLVAPAFTVAAESLQALSPLVPELLQEPEQSPEIQLKPPLNVMQAKVLESLSLFGYVHLQPPTTGDVLELSSSGPGAVEDRSGLSEHHQIVLAPEGSGKTTLAMLAAANNTLVHARATLLITRSEEQAKELQLRFQEAVEPSTVRWNLRFRRMGKDFAADLSRDIVPDIVISSLHELTTGILDNAEVYADFLRNVGLVVVDDVESFAGAVEIHAQLAFRRLRLLFRQVSEVEQLGEANAPLMLILGVDSMKEMAAWAKSLCGVQAVVRAFPAAVAETGESEDSAAKEDARQQKWLPFSELRTHQGRQLSVPEVVAACEAAGVPWCYRPCGDGRRHRGRGPLLLEQEPEHATTSPRDACVIFLDGRWSEVRRELQRSPWAGYQSGRQEVVVLVLVDPDEALACGALDPDLGFESSHDHARPDLAEELIALPLPVVRSPSSHVLQSHLLSDLVQNWFEVKDLVGTFEAPVAHRLRYLQSQGMLLTEERSDVQAALKEYEAKVYVRALAASLAIDEAGSSANDGIIDFPLLDKVRQVELVASSAVTIRNRADHTQLRTVEADSAAWIYYPGRIFEDSRGRFVVVGRARRGNRLGAIEVEPVLHDDFSSPRRWFERIEQDTSSREDLPVATSPDSPAQSEAHGYALYEKEPVLLGRHSIELGLVAIELKLHSLAVFRLDKLTFEVRAREIHAQRAKSEFPPEQLNTIAVSLFPNPQESSSSAPKLLLAEARLLTALLRFILPLIYRNVQDRLEVALIFPGQDGDKKLTGPWNSELENEAAIYLFDLHQGGDGTARALYRDGVELPLRFCRHFVATDVDVERIFRLHGHESSLQEVKAPQGGPEAVQSTDDEPEDEALEAWPWPEIRAGLLAWLDSRLHPEPIPESLKPQESEASNDEASEPEPTLWGEPEASQAAAEEATDDDEPEQEEPEAAILDADREVAAENFTAEADAAEESAGETEEA